MKINREALEKNQIIVYVAALVLGVVLGALFPQGSPSLNAMISPLLAVLLYSMFAQLPFLKLRKALVNRRFVAAILTTNFVIVPVVVWLLSYLLPQSTPVLIGVCLVLLTPCIDYVIVFTQLGRGNEKLMLAVTPILFVAQMLLLPLYLKLIIGEAAANIVSAGPFLESFLILIVLPLLVAIAVQLWAMNGKHGAAVLAGTAWLPVPFMAIVLFVIVASQIGKVYSELELILAVVPVYLLYLFIMPLISRVMAHWFRLDDGAGRALLFSSGTRNSLVVLPLALSLPGDWAMIASAVIVTQTIVELGAELVYIRIIPALLYRDSENTKR
ncbi:arsenic resistance protein [Paenibacillus sp. FSL H8-0548]|uniref:arsenic resistance protein n=1 Tax=Paenibacillus sp. FSL H8-0548 TaxID=1920422 RepID=UPI00096D093B|nr:bile acid:sodium symporter [Paenibacillus sp. FSL H8-0548]OMF22536.1 arsenic resistance protein [Paenibacillus sp. FSL H8-0548]